MEHRHQAPGLSAFLQFNIGHPQLEAVLARTLTVSQSQSKPEIIVITGPTGVGKTTLADRLEREVSARYADQMDRDRGMIPVVHIAVTTPGTSGFNWKDFYTRLLHQIDAVNPQLKLPICPSDFDMFASTYDIPRALPNTSTLERHFETAVKHRKVKMLILDEANQMLVGCHAAELQRRFEALKSLSLNTGVTIVLVGTYDLLQIRDQSAQLVRRSEIIHFPRYQCEDDKDRYQFGSVLKTFAEQMPFSRPPDLTSRVMEFYLLSVGCIGILKRWLNQAVEDAVRRGIDTPDADFFLDRAQCKHSAQTILTEASIGERRLVDIPLSVLQSQSQAQFLALKEMAVNVADLGKRMGRASQKRKVAERIAKRDPVGRTYDADQEEFDFA